MPSDQKYLSFGKANPFGQVCFSLQQSAETLAVAHEAQRLSEMIANGTMATSRYKDLTVLLELTQRAAHVIQDQGNGAPTLASGSNEVRFVSFHGELVRSEGSLVQFLSTNYFSPGFSLTRESVIGLLAELNELFGI